MRGVGGSFTGRLLGSELLVNVDVIFDLVAKTTCATDFPEIELASC